MRDEKIKQELSEIISSLPRWLYSKREYAPKMPINILAQFQPSKTKNERDYLLDPLLAQFYLAMLLRASSDPIKFECFGNVYFKQVRKAPIKTLAYKLGINHDTYYEWAHTTAESMLMLAKANAALKSDKILPTN